MTLMALETVLYILHGLNFAYTIRKHETLNMKHVILLGIANFVVTNTKKSLKCGNYLLELLLMTKL